MRALLWAFIWARIHAQTPTLRRGHVGFKYLERAFSLETQSRTDTGKESALR
jgi:hypothetical protein